MNENTNDVFEVYMDYVDKYDETDKQKLIDEFKWFLDHPMGRQCFIIRWKENDRLENTRSLGEYISKCDIK